MQIHSKVTSAVVKRKTRPETETSGGDYFRAAVQETEREKGLDAAIGITLHRASR